MARADRCIDVLVPLAAAGSDAGGSICELRASFSDEVPAKRSGYDPTIIPLLDVKLGAAGKRALDAVRRLPVARNRWDFYFRLTKPRSLKSLLTPLDARQARGLDPQNSSSAELGLALSLCCLERGNKNQIFFATGTLEGTLENDVGLNDGPVGSVGGLSQKIDTVATWLERHHLGAWGKKAVFFLPHLTTDGEETLKAHQRDLEYARERVRAIGIELEVIPLRSLAQGANLLQANRPKADAREIAARLSIVPAVGLIALSIGVMQPLTLKPAPIDFFLGPLTTPQVMSVSNVDAAGDRVFHPVVACLSKADLPLIQYDDYLSMRFETGQTMLPPRLVSILFVVVAEKSPPKFFTPEQIQVPTDPVTKVDGRITFGGSFAIGPPEEEMKVVALARPIFGFDVEGIAFKLNSIQEAEPQEAALNAQARWLAGLRSAYEEVSFHAVDPASESLAQCGS